MKRLGIIDKLRSKGFVMHTIKLQVHDSIYDHIMFILKNLNTKELKIIEDSVSDRKKSPQEYSETRVFSNHTANIIEDWQDDAEDAIWK